MKKRYTTRGLIRFLLMLAGNVLIGLGITLLRLADFGTDPFSSMNIGVSGLLPISYGTYQLIFNLSLFIVILFLYPKSFGVGALVNMIGVGYEVDFFMGTASLLGITIDQCATQYVLRVILLLLGLAVVCMGIALYVHCDLGIAPYDAVSIVVEQRTHGKISFRWARIALDVIAILISFVTGGPLGIATIVVGFFTGPLVAWFRRHIAEKLLPKHACVE